MQLKNNQNLVLWTEEHAQAFGQQPFKASHGLRSLATFSDSALASLLESHPRDALQAFTMGVDIGCQGEWQPVDTSGASGQDILSAVRRGRLWLNIHHVQQFHDAYREITNKLLSEVSEWCPTFQPLRHDVTLIISSPRALVYYHADAQPNLLWHVRGVKRVWVYPAGQRTLISQELMEDIFASFADEEAAYNPEFDEHATIFDVLPGDVISWPQNAPHRVTNLEGLNVSLSTVFETEQSDRRKLVYCANRFFRRTYRFPLWSTKETGMSAYLKRTAFRAFRRFGLVHTPPRRPYIADLRIDPEAPRGCTPLADGYVLTEFSRKDFTLHKDPSGQMTVLQHRSAR